MSLAREGNQRRDAVGVWKTSDSTSLSEAVSMAVRASEAARKASGPAAATHMASA